MKKVVIVTRSMIIGGIEKSLISLLESMPNDNFDVTVLVMGNGDEKSTIEKIMNNMKKTKFITAFKIVSYTLLAKRAATMYEQEEYHSKMLPNFR